jgi:glucose/arabinose dehydrogenase
MGQQLILASKEIRMVRDHYVRNGVMLIAVLFLTAACTTALQNVVGGTQAPPPPEAPVDAAATDAAATDAAEVTGGETGTDAAGDGEGSGAASLLPTATPAPAPDASAPDGSAPVTEPAPAAPALPDLTGVAVRLEPLLENLEQPLFVTHAGDGSGRLFVVEKVGRILLLEDGQLQPAPFLDITDKVSLSSEQGLLGLAFAPDFATSGQFYINYTNAIGDSVIARFAVAADDPNRADAASELPILQLDQPAPNHNGGMITFGPDGYLWIGMGDGGAANDRFGNGQNPQTLLGKMLRINVNSDPDEAYTIPADNPWVAADSNGQDVRNEIWAVGLRNPWRFSFDRQTGDLWIGDVGQNMYEEIHFVPAGSAGGLNFGWPIMEGLHCFQEENCDPTGLEMPVAEYTHAGNCSVTGGYVYRGAAHPAWNGVYFYGDYCGGRIWGLAPDGSGGWTTVELLQNPMALSSFGEDEAGELYVTDLSGGVVYRMVE